MLSQVISRPRRRYGAYVDGLTNDGEAIEGDDFNFSSENSDEFGIRSMSLPPRYRFRDLLLGDFAFRDDGER